VEILYATPVITEQGIRIFHVGSQETMQKLRDDILRLHGFEVDSTLSLSGALEQISKGRYDLVLIDIESGDRVADAVHLCDEIKKDLPHQHVAYVCNYRVSVDSECPDEIIRAEFNPKALVTSVKQLLAKR
jgi:CheY-like chemotaxis protein